MPSSYSSRQTTHSFCRPPYRRLHCASPVSRFSSSRDCVTKGAADDVAGLSLGDGHCEEAGVVVCRGECCSSGVVGDDALGVADDVDSLIV